jgi:hypothetical protein
MLSILSMKKKKEGQTCGFDVAGPHMLTFLFFRLGAQTLDP